MSDYAQSESSVYEDMVERARYIELNLFFNVQSWYLPKSILQCCQINIGKQVLNQDESRRAGINLNFKIQDQIDLMMTLKPFELIYIDKKRSDVPLHLLIPNYELQKITDEMINEAQKGVIENFLEDVLIKPSSTKEIEKDELSYRLKIIIEDIRQEPFISQAERSAKLNLNPKTLNDGIDELVKLDLLEYYKEKFSLGKGSGQFHLILLTPVAKEKFGKMQARGKSSWKHSFWQYRGHLYYMWRGFKTKIEYFIKHDGESQTRESVDLVVYKDESDMTAIEIELNFNTHILENAHKCIQAGFKKIIIAVSGSNNINYVQKLLLNDPLAESWLSKDKIEIKLLSEFWE